MADYLKTWHNFRTSQDEIREDAPTDFSDYMPQSEMVQLLYSGYIKAGKTPLDAFIDVMKKLTKQ